MAVIYEIKNKLNNKCYIGVAKNFDKRIKKHFKELRYNKHHNSHLQNVYNKNGNVFECSILKIYDNIQEAFKNEAEFIEKYGHYNIATGGFGGDTITNHPNKQVIFKKVSNSLKGRDVGFGKGYSHSDETKKKIGLANSGSNNGNCNRIFSKDEREKLSSAQKKRYESVEERRKCNVFKNLSPEEYSQRCKVWSEAAKGSKNGRFKYNKKVKQIDKITNEVVKIYDYVRLVDADGYNSKYVIYCCNNVSKSHKGYIWQWD